MKVVKLKPRHPANNRHPERSEGSGSYLQESPKQQTDSSPTAQSDGPVLDDWQYQAKRRDQVESSYKIFAFCLLAALFFTLMALITNT